MAEMTIAFPDKDVAALFANIQRAQTELGKDAKRAIAWGGAYLCDSLGASTRKAPAYRRLYKATPQRVGGKGLSKGERDLMREESKAAPYGVYTYQGGKPVFRRIKAVARNVIPFRSKTTGRMLGREKGSNEAHRIESFVTRSKEDLRSHPLVKIENAGLAKMAWKIAKAKVVSGGEGFAMRVKRAIVAVRWWGGATNPTILIEDRLGYAIDAFKGDGKQAVNSAVERASNKLAKRIEDALERRIKKAAS